MDVIAALISSHLVIYYSHLSLCALFSPGFGLARQFDIGRAGRQSGSVCRIRVDVDGSTRLPVVVKGSGNDQVRTADFFFSMEKIKEKKHKLVNTSRTCLSRMMNTDITRERGKKLVDRP